MTEQPVNTRPGVWDSVFGLVFGRPGSRTSRARPAPRSAPQTAPPVTRAPAPAPEPQAPPQPADIAPQRQPGSAPSTPDAPVNVEAEQPPPTPATGPTNIEAEAHGQPAPVEEPITSQPAPAESTEPAPAGTAEPAPTSSPATDAQPAPVVVNAFVDALVAACRTEFDLFKQGTLVESSDEGSALVAKYWQALDADNTGSEERLTGKSDVAWSAAFVSYVMRQAGAGTRFKYNAGHHGYIKPAIRDKGMPDAAFEGYRPEDYAPQIGDLIGNLRDQSGRWREANPGKSFTLENAYDTANDYQDFSSHCDIVIGKEGAELLVIGGNVSNRASGGSGVTVNIKRIPIGEDGKIPADVARRREIFVILKNNLTTRE